MLLAAVSVGIAAATPLAVYDLETSDGGFVDTYAGGDVPQWAWGPVVNGPGAGYDGLNAWATGLVLDYRNDTTNCLRLPVPDLGGAARPVLAWQQWYAIASGDSAVVLVDDGTGWRALDPIYGYPEAEGWTGQSGGWENVAVDLSGLGAAPQLCLRFAVDGDGVVDDGWFIDNVGYWDGDVMPPRVDTVDAPVDTEDLAGPYRVHMIAQDDVAVSGATLTWAAGGAPTTTPMVQGDDGGWDATIPGQPADTRVTWHIDLTDGANASRHPAVGDAGFRVYLPAPQDLDGPDGRVVASAATLTWAPPESVHVVQSYEVLEGDVVVASTTALEAEVPLSGGVEAFTVRARYDVGPGDATEPVEVDGLLPTVTGLAPAEGYGGERLRIDLTGDYLLLVEGEVDAGLGDGVTVVGVDVRNVDRAVIEVEIDPLAASGPRTLTLDTPVGEVESVSAFTVLDAADRPRLTGASPPSLRQGEQGEVTITYVGVMSGLPLVDIAEGIVVESVEDDGAGVLIVDVAVATNAPLGDHAVTVDDGVRILTGAVVEVDDVLLPGSGGGCGCATGRAAGPAGLGWTGVLLGGAWLRWRRRSPVRPPPPRPPPLRRSESGDGAHLRRTGKMQ